MRYRSPLAAAGVVLTLIGLVGCAEPPREGPPFTPQESLAQIEIDDRFTVELFASEPLISDPVDMEIDEDGNVFVVEDHGYPEYRAGSSFIKLLHDADGDGRLDQSTIFADSLVSPRGIMRWKDGLIVTDAPDILYLEDSDGDGRADVREVLLSGFGTVNPQRGVNNPIYGLDNWIYFAHGDRDTDLHWGDGTAAPDVRGRNLRVRFDDQALEPTAVRSQFGHSFDAWGRHFQATNADHLYREAIAARYLQRKPSFVLESARDQLPDHGAAADIFPITEDPDYQLFTDVGVITSACGITTYLGGAFPEDFTGATVVAEPTHNLVHLDVIEPRGSSFVGRRMYSDREFMASRDSWFRPVNFYVGPDGALYVLDYHRGIIEQPKFLTDDVMGGLYEGEDLGRIYRIVPKGGLSTDWMKDLRLSTASEDALIAELESANIWRRQTAQRLLVQRGDTSRRADLERLAHESVRPEGRLHALWTLDGLGVLGSWLIAEALEDPSPGVRENAVRLAELHLDATPSLANRLVEIGNDEDAHVRYQLLLTLGYVNTAEASRLRDALLFSNVEDEWMQAAALTAEDADLDHLFREATVRLDNQETSGARRLMSRIGAMAASDGGGRAMLQRSLSGQDNWWRSSVISGIAEGARRGDVSGLQGERARLLSTWESTENPALRSALVDLLEVVGLPDQREASIVRLASIASDTTNAADFRADALALLRLDSPDSHADIFLAALEPSEPLPVQRAGLDGLRAVEGNAVGKAVVEKWGRLTPEFRAGALDLILRDSARIRALLDAVEAGQVHPASLEWSRRKRIMMTPETALRARARRLLAPEEEGEVVARYEQALEMDGDPTRGAEIYSALCSTCHQIGGSRGTPYGPDLATIQSRRPEFILTDILVPGSEIVTGYEQWVVELHDGERLVGLIASESPTSVTVRQLGREDRTIPRSDIQSMQASDASAMPGGFGQQLDQEGMADLLAFLKRPNAAED